MVISGQYVKGFAQLYSALMLESDIRTKFKGDGTTPNGYKKRDWMVILGQYVKGFALLQKEINVFKR